MVFEGMDGEIVGLDAENNGRSCTLYDVCDQYLQVDNFNFRNFVNLTQSKFCLSGYASILHQVHVGDKIVGIFEAGNGTLDS